MTKFKDEFVWGTAASSYQIEGGVKDNGRGDSVWDMFCRQPGWVRDSSDGRTACDGTAATGDASPSSVAAD